MRKVITYLFVIVFVCHARAQVIDTPLSYSVSQPSTLNAKTPVLILLHGYGSNENDLLDMAQAFDPKFITFSIRAPFKAGNGGFSWYDVEFLQNNEMKYAYSQVKESKKLLLSFISKACAAYHADSTQVYVLGFSQGAIMAYEIAVSAPKKVKGIISLSGRMLEETRTVAADWKQVTQVKIFIAHGHSDNVIKFTDSEKAYAFFKEKKVADLTFKNYEMPHSISGSELNDIKVWLTKALQPVLK
ncbi:MAG: dienelactone hydrolase family protein [bacterium]|nr:dienelactone hydrolase family protein [bacterium]